MLDQIEFWELLILACLACLSFEPFFSRLQWFGRLFRLVWTGMLCTLGVQLATRYGHRLAPDLLWLGAGIGVLCIRTAMRIFHAPSAEDRWRWFAFGLGFLALAPFMKIMGVSVGDYGAGVFAAIWLAIGLDVLVAHLVRGLQRESRMADLLWSCLAWLKVFEHLLGARGWSMTTPFYLAIGVWGLGLGDWIREPWQSRIQRIWGVSLLFLLFGDLVLEAIPSKTIGIPELLKNLLWIWAAWGIWIARFRETAQEHPAGAIVSFSAATAIVGTAWWLLEAMQQIVHRGAFDWSETTLFFLMSLWLTMVAQGIWNAANSSPALGKRANSKNS